MCDNIKREHLKLPENINENMKDFIIQIGLKSCFEIGKGALGRDMIFITAMRPIWIKVQIYLKESKILTRNEIKVI